MGLEWHNSERFCQSSVSLLRIGVKLGCGVTFVRHDLSAWLFVSRNFDNNVSSKKSLPGLLNCHSLRDSGFIIIGHNKDENSITMPYWLTKMKK